MARTSSFCSINDELMQKNSIFVEICASAENETKNAFNEPHLKSIVSRVNPKEKKKLYHGTEAAAEILRTDYVCFVIRSFLRSTRRKETRVCVCVCVGTHLLV